MSDHVEVGRAASAGYRLGDPIALEDLLALPSDGARYARDAEGRLTPMSPDCALGHGYPLTVLQHLVLRALAPGFEVLQECGIALDPILHLRGHALPESRLGRRTLEPDLAVFSGRPRVLPHRAGTRHRVFAQRGLALVIVLLSRDTRASDLGRGQGDAVDRWRTYLANGVPEYWVLNADTVPLGLPPRSGLFLRRAGAEWLSLEVEGAVRAPARRALHGHAPVRSGVVRSQAVPGLTLDLAAFWSSLELEEDAER
jgi:hypothetical protein